MVFVRLRLLSRQAFCMVVIFSLYPFKVTSCFGDSARDARHARCMTDAALMTCSLDRDTTSARSCEWGGVSTRVPKGDY
jgi:hypothetical protein